MTRFLKMAGTAALLAVLASGCAREVPPPPPEFDTPIDSTVTDNPSSNGVPDKTPRSSGPSVESPSEESCYDSGGFYSDPCFGD